MEGQRRMFDKEFKQRTVELILSGEKKAIKATEELGIDNGNVYRWIKEYKQDRRDTFPGNGKLKPEDEELRKFKRQLADVTYVSEVVREMLDENGITQSMSRKGNYYDNAPAEFFFTHLKSN